MPDNILTNELLSKFEDASSIKDSQLQEETFIGLIRQLPVYNKILLSWLMNLWNHVIEKVGISKTNKKLFLSLDAKLLMFIGLGAV